MAKILLIEDEEHIRAAISEELLDSGFDVSEAASGAEGLQAILNLRPDLVVCDWLMPGMTGGELLKTLRADHGNFDELPFVFLSAHADQVHKAEGLELGADAYLTKPIDFDLLLETVDTLISKEAA